MKKVYIIYGCLIALIAVVGIIEMLTPDGAEINPTKLFKVKNEFHVRVDCYGGGNDAWVISFTKNNWLLEQHITDAFDISGGNLGIYVCHQPRIFRSQEKAVEFAKQFTTIEKCFYYNDSIKTKYEYLLAYRKSNPPPPEPKEPAKEICEKVEIY